VKKRKSKELSKSARAQKREGKKEGNANPPPRTHGTQSTRQESKSCPCIPPAASSHMYQNSSLAAQLGNKNGSNASHQMAMGRYDVSMLFATAMRS